MAQYGEFFGELDFTILSRLWRDHKELFQMVDFKDGKHALLKVNLNERQQPDQHGNTHYLKANCKKAEQKEGVNYFVGSNFRPSQTNASNQPNAHEEPQVSDSTDSADKLPF